jgi:hypothetical protein
LPRYRATPGRSASAARSAQRRDGHSC